MILNDLFTPFGDELQLRPSPHTPNPPLIEWRAALGDFFFRPKGADPQILWCDVGYTISPKRPLPPPRPTTLAKRVSRAFNGCTFFRVVPFPDGDDWLLVRPRRAIVKSPHQPAGALWKWNCASNSKLTQLDWLSQPQSWFESHLKDLKDDLPLQMARDCAALGEDERQWNPSASPETAHWKTLALALFILATPASISSVSWTITRPKSIEGPVVPLCYSSANSKPRLLFPQSAEVLLQLLQSSISLPYWRSLDASYERIRTHFPFYRIEAITHHERLEAALLWRDFGQQIGKSVEVEGALSELMS